METSAPFSKAADPFKQPGHPFKQPGHPNLDEVIKEIHDEQIRRLALERQEEAAYIKLKAQEGAKRRLQEEQAAARGPITDRILTVSQLKALPRPEPLIENVLYTGSVSLFLGNSQVGKTWILISLSTHAATGMEWPTGGLNSVPPIPILYVAAEDGGSIAARLEHWERWTGRQLEAPGIVFHTHPTSINLLDEVAVEELAEVVDKRGYRLVVIDTVSSTIAGAEEDNSNFALLIKHSRMLTQAMARVGGGSVALVHHFGKEAERGARGGSSLFNDADIVWEMSGDLDDITMTNKKWKTDSAREPFHLKLERSEPDNVHLARNYHTSTDVMGWEGSKTDVLIRQILSVVEDYGHLNQGYGPNVREIHGKLQQLNVPARTQDVVNQLAALRADGRLHTRQGPNRQVFHRLPPRQEPLQ